MHWTCCSHPCLTLKDCVTALSWDITKTDIRRKTFGNTSRHTHQQTIFFNRGVRSSLPGDHIPICLFEQLKNRRVEVARSSILIIANVIVLTFFIHAHLSPLGDVSGKKACLTVSQFYQLREQSSTSHILTGKTPWGVQQSSSRCGKRWNKELRSSENHDDSLVHTTPRTAHSDWQTAQVIPGSTRVIWIRNQIGLTWELL